MIVGVLHPHDRRTAAAGLLDQRADVGDHLVTLVGVLHHAALDVDDEQGGVRTVGKRGHPTILPGSGRRSSRRSAPRSAHERVWHHAIGWYDEHVPVVRTLDR